MRAREFVTEVFNLTSPQTVWSSGGTDTQATWTDKTGARVTTVFRKVGKTVDVSFVRTDAQGTPTWGRANNAGGSSSSVFGGVAANLKDYLAKNPNITHVTFGASDDPERSRLYSMGQRPFHVLVRDIPFCDCRGLVRCEVIKLT